jgi:hypothetical protein
MCSSTYKTNTRPTEQRSDHVDHPEDDNFLNIRLDSLDLERAAATLDDARCTDKGTKLPYRGLGVFRITRAPRTPPQQPHRTPVRPMQRNVPRPVPVHLEPETFTTYPSDRNQTPVLAPLYLSRVRSSVRNQDGFFGDGSCAESVTRNITVERPPHGQDPLVSSPPAVAMPPRLSDYGRYLVSLKRDFSSVSRKSDCRSRPQ